MISGMRSVENSNHCSVSFFLFPRVQLKVNSSGLKPQTRFAIFPATIQKEIVNMARIVAYSGRGDLVCFESSDGLAVIFGERVRGVQRQVYIYTGELNI
jgi:hypothetical protein